MQNISFQYWQLKQGCSYLYCIKRHFIKNTKESETGSAFCPRQHSTRVHFSRLHRSWLDVQTNRTAERFLLIHKHSDFMRNNFLPCLYQTSREHSHCLCGPLSQLRILWCYFLRQFGLLQDEWPRISVDHRFSVIVIWFGRKITLKKINHKNNHVIAL